MEIGFPILFLGRYPLLSISFYHGIQFLSEDLIPCLIPLPLLISPYWIFLPIPSNRRVSLLDMIPWWEFCSPAQSLYWPQSFTTISCNCTIENLLSTPFLYRLIMFPIIECNHMIEIWFTTLSLRHSFLLRDMIPWRIFFPAPSFSIIECDSISICLLYYSNWW